MKRAVFFDRDGIVNVDTNYVHKIEEFVFCKKIFDVMLFFQKKEYLLFIITNQSGIGRGIYTENDFHKLTYWMVEELKRKGIILEKVYFDPFHPVYGLGHYKKDSFNRKPKPGMILDAQKCYNLCLNRSILVGDKESDIQAGVAANIQKTFFINLSEVCTRATYSFRSLADFFNYLQIHSSEF